MTAAKIATPRADLLTIRNVHALANGARPPAWIASGRGRLHYFENVYGEQFVARVDDVMRVVRITGGDLGWKTHTIPFSRVDDALRSLSGGVPGISTTGPDVVTRPAPGGVLGETILGVSEAAWCSLVLRTALERL